MTQQPEALRLADALTEKEYPPRRAAAVELRRLHAVNAQLLEALESLAAADFGAGEWTESAEQAALKARAAITAAKEKNHE
jgi:hypothetical protein